MLLSKPNRKNEALSLILRYAGSRVCSRSEVLAYLRRRGLPPQTAARALEAAAALGVVDDRACARLWCSHWARQNYAAAAIEERLSAKGIGPAAIRQALADLKKEEGDRSRARRWIRSQKRRSDAQLLRALAARGFDEELIEELIGHPNNNEEP